MVKGAKFWGKGAKGDGEKVGPLGPLASPHSLFEFGVGGGEVLLGGQVRS